MDTRSQILRLLSSIRRPGMDALIDYVQSSNYFTANCNGHHFIGTGGVAQHSMEVLEHMKHNNTIGLSEESVILCALTHDLGKTAEAREDFPGRRHDQRSLMVLRKCGVPLSEAEKTAVLNHKPGHEYRIRTMAACPLYALLVKADGHSASEWQKAHPKEVAERRERRAKSRWYRHSNHSRA